MSTVSAKPPRAASTILLLRDSVSTAGEIEVFMMVRHYEIDFNSGALVFPGGSVDKGDQEIIADPALYSGGEGLDAVTLSFRIAAIRETFEESGILLARPRGSKALVDARRAGEIEAAHRADLCDCKVSFLKVLTDNGMVLAVEDDGPGCSPDDLSRIAHRGVRLDEVTEGHGLGLSIAGSIASSYGAEMRFGRSQELGGFEVRVTFPAT